MNSQVLEYAQKVRAGEITVHEIPKKIRKEVISKLRELLAIVDALEGEQDPDECIA